MLKLQPGKSYAWIFAIFAALFVLLFFGTTIDSPWLIVAFFGGASAMIAYLIACQISSGIALEPCWRAKYLRGSWQYRATLAWHAFGTVVFLVIALFAMASPAS